MLESLQFNSFRYLDDANRNGMPTVLRIVFPADGERQVSATLVL